MEEIIRGRVFEGQHVTPAGREYPRVGDVVEVLAGKHEGRAGKVAGRLDISDGPMWMVMRTDGVIMGRYPHTALLILIEGS